MEMQFVNRAGAYVEKEVSWDWNIYKKREGLYSQKEQGELFYVCFVIMSYEILPSTSSKLVGLG